MMESIELPTDYDFGGAGTRETKALARDFVAGRNRPDSKWVCPDIYFMSVDNRSGLHN